MATSTVKYLSKLAKERPSLKKILAHLMTEYGLRTIRLTSMKSQDESKPFYNGEGYTWFVVKANGESMSYQTDTQDSLHAGSFTKDVNARFHLPAGAIAFLVRYSYETTGCGYTLSMTEVTGKEPVIIITEDNQPQLGSGL